MFKTSRMTNWEAFEACNKTYIKYNNEVSYNTLRKNVINLAIHYDKICLFLEYTDLIKVMKDSEFQHYYDPASKVDLTKYKYVGVLLFEERYVCHVYLSPDGRSSLKYIENKNELENILAF